MPFGGFYITVTDEEPCSKTEYHDLASRLVQSLADIFIDDTHVSQLCQSSKAPVGRLEVSVQYNQGCVVASGLLTYTSEGRVSLNKPQLTHMIEQNYGRQLKLSKRMIAKEEIESFLNVQSVEEPA